MKRYNIIVSLSGGYELEIEAENKEDAIVMASAMELEPELVGYWDTTTEIEEID